MENTKISSKMKHPSDFLELDTAHECNDVGVGQQASEEAPPSGYGCGMKRKHEASPGKTVHISYAGCQRIPMRVRVDNLRRKFPQLAIYLPTKCGPLSQIAPTPNVSLPFTTEDTNFVTAPPTETR